MKKLAASTLTAGMILCSCNLPAAGRPDAQVGTLAALTIQAAIDSTPSAGPGVEGTGLTPTATYSKPMLSVEDVTNCRSGPGINYERITQITPGGQVDVVGVFPPGYWIVSTGAGTCWVSAEFATPVGSVGAVPTVTAPATPEGRAPTAPTFRQNGWNYFCFGSGEMEVTFNWRDNADNETGYRILRNGGVIAELPRNSTTFYEKIMLLPGQSASYEIEAYNPIGSSRSGAVTLDC